MKENPCTPSAYGSPIDTSRELDGTLPLASEIPLSLDNDDGDSNSDRQSNAQHKDQQNFDHHDHQCTERCRSETIDLTSGDVVRLDPRRITEKQIDDARDSAGLDYFRRMIDDYSQNVTEQAVTPYGQQPYVVPAELRWVSSSWALLLLGSSLLGLFSPQSGLTSLFVTATYRNPTKH